MPSKKKPAPQLPAIPQELIDRSVQPDALGDALHALMCGAGHNLRLILAALRL